MRNKLHYYSRNRLLVIISNKKAVNCQHLRTNEITDSLQHINAL